MWADLTSERGYFVALVAAGNCDLSLSFLLSLPPAPDFVRGLSDEEYVYFFFREQAVEYINCGKVSGVATTTRNTVYIFAVLIREFRVTHLDVEQLLLVLKYHYQLSCRPVH